MDVPFCMPRQTLPSLSVSNITIERGNTLSLALKKQADIEVESRQNSADSQSSLSTSPSLQSIYQIRRNSSFRKLSICRSYSNGLEDSLFLENNYFNSPASSYGSFDIDVYDHPLSLKETECAIAFEEDEEENENLQEIENDKRSLSISHALIGRFKRDSFSNSENVQKIVEFFSKINDSIQRTILRQDQKPFSNFVKDVPLETFSQEFELNSHLQTLSISVPLSTDELLFDKSVSKISVKQKNISLNQNFTTFVLNGKTRRFREERINPDYLRQYAIDSSCRNKGLYNITDEELNIFDEFLFQYYSPDTQQVDSLADAELFEFNLRYYLNSLASSDTFFRKLPPNQTLSIEYLTELKLASITRYKLWEYSKLKPRDDELPSLTSFINSFSCRNIFDLESELSSESMSKQIVPWLKFGETVNNFRLRQEKKKRLAGVGLQGNPCIQYVSKGCINLRWEAL